MSENNYLNKSNKKQEAIGFMGLVSKKHQLASLIDMSEGAEQLGFSELNAYFSARLYPGISTLMPNLVYCYMIFALTWEGKLSATGKDDEKINNRLADITDPESEEENIDSLVKKNMGFHHRGIAESIIGTYRHFMERYGFFDKNTDSAFFMRNNNLRNNTKKGLKGDNKYDRFNKINGALKSDGSFNKEITDDNEWKSGFSPVLLNIEQEDMTERCKLAIRADVENNQPLSLFDLIVCRYATGEVNKKDELLPFFENLSTDYSDDNKSILCGNYETMMDEELLCFYGLNKEDFLKDLSEDDKVSLCQKIRELMDCYEAARFVSVMEFYLKCRSNQLLLEKKREIWGIGDKNTGDENIIEIVQNLKDKWSIENGDLCPDKLKTAVENNPKYVEKMERLWNFYILSCKNKKDDVDGEIWKLMEANSTGVTILNRKAINEYHDTFRWEYRPTEDMREKSGFAGNDKMCASYFVNEIFAKEKK